MRFFTAIKTALSSYSEALVFINTHKMYRYFLWPVMMHIVLFLLGFTGVSYLTDTTIEFLKSFVAENPEAWYNSEVLTGVLAVTLWIILRIFFFIAFAYVGGYVVLLLLSPILSLVAATATEKITGTQVPFQFSQFLNDILRGVSMAVRNFIYQLVITVALLIIGFIPILGWLSPILLFGVSSYFYGFSFIDYALESKQLNYGQSVRFVQKNKVLSAGIGLPYVILLLVPFIGLILAGFFAIVSTVSATIAIHKKEYISQLPQ
jgi:CysZ protein